jgi:hypothetical protein
MECGSKIDLAGLASDKIDAQIAASSGRLSADELSKMIKRISVIPSQNACRRKFCKLHHVEASTSAQVASSIPQQFPMAMAVPLSTDTAALPTVPSTLLQSSPTPIQTHCVPLPGTFTPFFSCVPASWAPGHIPNGISTPGPGSLPADAFGGFYSAPAPAPSAASSMSVPPPMGGMGVMGSMSGGTGGPMGGIPGPIGGGMPSQMGMGIPTALAVPFAFGGMAAFVAEPAGGATSGPAGSASRVASTAGATSLSGSASTVVAPAANDATATAGLGTVRKRLLPSDSTVELRLAAELAEAVAMAAAAEAEVAVMAARAAQENLDRMVAAARPEVLERCANLFGPRAFGGVAAPTETPVAGDSATALPIAPSAVVSSLAEHGAHAEGVAPKMMDKAVQEETRNVARSVVEAVKALRAGQLSQPDQQLKVPRAK